jgi:hypothetical protein
MKIGDVEGTVDRKKVYRAISDNKPKKRESSMNYFNI